MNKEIEKIINDFNELKPLEKNISFFMNTFTNKGNLFKYIKKIALSPSNKDESFDIYYRKNKKTILEGIELLSDKFEELDVDRKYGLGDVTAILQNFYKTPEFIHGNNSDKYKTILVSRNNSGSSNGWLDNEKYLFDKRSKNGNYDIPTNIKISKGNRNIAIFEKQGNFYIFLGYFHFFEEKWDHFILKKGDFISEDIFISKELEAKNIVIKKELKKIVEKEKGTTIKDVLKDINDNSTNEIIVESELLENQKEKNKLKKIEVNDSEENEVIVESEIIQNLESINKKTDVNINNIEVNSQKNKTSKLNRKEKVNLEQDNFFEYVDLYDTKEIKNKNWENQTYENIIELTQEFKNDSKILKEIEESSKIINNTYNNLKTEINDQTRNSNDINISKNDIINLQKTLEHELKQISKKDSNFKKNNLSFTKKEQEIINREEIYDDEISNLLLEIIYKANKKIVKLRKLQEKEECEISGISNKEMLDVFFIKPWIDSDNNEKIDVNNVILLNTFHGFLFEKGLISFHPLTGEMKFSKIVPEVVVQRWKNSKIEINEKRIQYLKYNNNFIFRK